MQTTPCEDFSLKDTMESGQFFYFYREENSYIIIERDNIFKVQQIDNLLYFKGTTEEKIRDFFQLDFNLNELYHPKLDAHAHLTLTTHRGLRLINQDLWQCIVGFVCSSAANIEKIKTNCRLIAHYFGEKIEFEGKSYYLFPNPGQINDITKLQLAKTGYRAQYIYAINKIVNQNPKLLEEIKQANQHQAMELLTTLPGIGTKIANCIVLFSLKHYEAFPIDTWVKKIFEKYYIGEKTTIKQIEHHIENAFPKGTYRGYTQQYLFHYERNL